MDKFVRLVERVSYGTGYAGALVLLAIIVLTMIEVISRYVLNNPLILSDELGGYAMVMVTFLGLAYCAQEKGHIRITFLVERLNPLTAGRIRILTLVLGLVLVAVAAWVSWKFLGDSFRRDMRSNSMLRTPLKWPQMAIPVGFTLFALVLLGQLVVAFKRMRAGRAADEFSAEEF
jgi:TRAP-type C4-dicarboxylate transport system permease small subunit